MRIDGTVFDMAGADGGTGETACASEIGALALVRPSTGHLVGVFHKFMQCLDAIPSVVKTYSKTMS